MGLEANIANSRLFTKTNFTPFAIKAFAEKLLARLLRASSVPFEFSVDAVPGRRRRLGKTAMNVRKPRLKYEAGAARDGS